MITWIQVLLQKHHKIIFSVLLFVIIIAFVFTIGSSIPFFGGNEASATVNRKNFYGYNLDDQYQMAQLQRQAVLDLRLSDARIDQNSLTEAMLKSAYLGYAAKKMCVNRISNSEFEAFVKSLPKFQKDGKFDAAAWKEFSTAFTKSMALDEDKFAAMMASVAVVRSMEKLFAGPGYVSDVEVSRFYEEQNGVWNVLIASLNYEKFNPKTKATEEELQKYFELNKESFRVPAAVALDVAFIPAKDFAVADENFSEEEIEKFYRSTIRKYLTQDEKGIKAKDLKDVKAEVVKDLKNANAVNRALSKADEILTGIYDADVKFASAEFKKILSDAKLDLKSLPLVRPDEKKPDGIPAEVFDAGFELNEQKFYCDPVAAEDGAYLVFFRESKASYLPEFAQVKAEVERAYLAQKKSELFSKKGQDFAEKMKASKADAKAFEAAAKADGFEVKDIEKFSFANPMSMGMENAKFYGALARTLPMMKAGEVSPMVTLSGEGFVVFAKSFAAPDKNASKAEIEKLANRARAEFSQVSSGFIINHYINAGMPKSAVPEE